VDDDMAQPPFLQNPPEGEEAQGGTPFQLMQTSDDKNENLYAVAYIKPVYDLTSGTVPFNRNVEPGTDHANQVRNSQNSQSTPEFWVVYLQGAFQGPTFFIRTSGILGDADPISEVTASTGVSRGAELGRTSAIEQLDRTLTGIGGSTVYYEVIRDG
jgi:hypothetical protein